ncbi:GNAT family N-acetyltransferase [Streptomyces filamentosus]|uniref:GNAT family N-acetyltransferase n=1 Tax=Streptomyces filamentosus TaxID=67294 RepID=UPI0037D10D7E
MTRAAQTCSSPKSSAPARPRSGSSPNTWWTPLWYAADGHVRRRRDRRPAGRPGRIEIDSRFAGQGPGGLLARGALDDLRVRGLHVLPYRPFIRGRIGRHPECTGLVPEAHRARFGLRPRPRRGAPLRPEAERHGRWRADMTEVEAERMPRAFSDRGSSRVVHPGERRTTASAGRPQKCPGRPGGVGVGRRGPPGGNRTLRPPGRPTCSPARTCRPGSGPLPPHGGTTVRNRYHANTALTGKTQCVTRQERPIPRP